LRPRVQPLKIPRARQSLLKEKQAIFEQNEEFHVSTSQNPRFLPGTLYFSTFYLKHLAKIFLFMRFEKILKFSVIIKNNGKWFSPSLFDTMFSQNQQQNCNF